MQYEFYDPQERQLSEKFLRDKYIITEVENKDSLAVIQMTLAAAAAKAINLPIPEASQVEDFLNNIHEMVTVEQLNEVRL